MGYLTKLGVKLSDEKIDEITGKFKRMGSSISTVRMVSVYLFETLGSSFLQYPLRYLDNS